jgi:hypothetical protein
VFPVRYALNLYTRTLLEGTSVFGGMERVAKPAHATVGIQRAGGYLIAVMCIPGDVSVSNLCQEPAVLTENFVCLLSMPILG